MNEFSFATRQDCLAALDTLLRQARRLIRIRDVDLRGQDWDAPARPALLEEFLRSDRARRVEILLHDGRYLTGHCPLLMKLLCHYGQQIEIRVHDEIAPSEACYVLGDTTLLLQRYQRDAWRGRYSANDGPGVIALAEQFAADWERSPGALAYTPLGL